MFSSIALPPFPDQINVKCYTYTSVICYVLTDNSLASGKLRNQILISSTRKKMEISNGRVYRIIIIRFELFRTIIIILRASHLSNHTIPLFGSITIIFFAVIQIFFVFRIKFVLTYVTFLSYLNRKNYVRTK